MSQPLVYIVDKSIAYQKVVEGCLKAMNISNIKLFDDGELCYSCDEESADLLILDYNLGEGKWNGLEFMEEYSRLHPRSKYLFLSSNTGMELAVETVRKGALDYILKSKLGLTRLAKQVENVRQSHSNKTRNKALRTFTLVTIIMLSTITAAVSLISVYA